MLSKQRIATITLALILTPPPSFAKNEDGKHGGGWDSRARVRLLAIARTSGVARDLSGLDGALEDGTPHNRLGGFGSALTYSGRGHEYIALSDRGPKDGMTSYWTRLHTFEINLHSGPQWKLDVQLRDTKLFTTRGPASEQQPLIGHSGDLDFRFDPEGVVADESGFLVADEYGPSLKRFNIAGQEIFQVAIPEKFKIANPAADPDDELPPRNLSGRQPNKGFEGLTRDAERGEIYTVLQAPLLQDSALESTGSKIGRIVRILALPDPSEGGHGSGISGAVVPGHGRNQRQRREFAYVLDSPKNGVSEILALGQMQFLIIERDGKSGNEAKFKKIFLVDASKADDISGVRSLPCCAMPDGFNPALKNEFIDLIKTTKAFDGSIAPEKPEGLTLGPDLPNGEKLLLVASDNDFEEAQSSWIWAYAITLQK